jgi:hypothetical protein
LVAVARSLGRRLSRPHAAFRRNIVGKKSKRQDVRELTQFAKAKTPAAQIARKLKRTEGATGQKG